MDRMTSTRMGRRHVMRAGLGLAAAASLGLVTARTSAAPKIESTERGEMPTTGGQRPGPIGLNPQPMTLDGARPITIQIEVIGVDAQIEMLEAVNGVMQDPTGPWVVSWYKETARLGELGNTVLAGHIDYWDVGPAVFYGLSQLEEDDEVRITGDDDTVYVYRVEWNRLYETANAPMDEIVGLTDFEALTMITCGGPFDYQTGQYLQRTVVRARFDRTE